MIDKTFIEKIESLAEANIFEIGGFNYSDKAIHRVAAPTPEPIELSTLDSLVTAIANEHSAGAPVYVQIKDEARISVFSGYADDLTRQYYYRVVPQLPKFPFSSWLDAEDMIIRLRSVFAPSDDREYLLSLLSRISEDSGTELEDDGVTQKVQTRHGVSLKGNETTKPILRLRPYRTFLEVEQPESEFLVRIQTGPKVALFESDGGMWRLSAQALIMRYLEDAFNKASADNVIILA